jgi:kynurenine formamidase
MSTDAPVYRDLPTLPGLDVRCSWGVFGNSLGALNFVSSESALHAAGLIQTGQTVGLNLAVDAFDPPLFSRASLRHSVVEVNRQEAEDILDAFNPQASSQLDGLAHVRAREHGYYGGITDLEEARDKLGIHHIAKAGIAGRGVLLDVAGRRELRGLNADPFVGEMFDADELAATAADQGVEFRPGDILLVRTAWAPQYLRLGVEERARVVTWNGLRPDERMAEFLWDHRVALIGTDNPAVEAAPGSREIGSLHRRLLPGLGLNMMELLDLEELAVRCRQSQRWEFFFVSVPMHLRGAVSSPSNAMAVL